VSDITCVLYGDGQERVRKVFWNSELMFQSVYNGRGLAGGVYTALPGWSGSITGIVSECV
jgi:hypothetical protein